MKTTENVNAAGRSLNRRVSWRGIYVANMVLSGVIITLGLILHENVWIAVSAFCGWLCAAIEAS